VSSEGSTPSACIDADVVVLTNGKRSIELGGEPELIAARDSPAAKDQHMVVYLQSYINAAQSVQDELDADARCTCAHGKDVCDVASESESGDSLASSNIGDSWWALFKVVWPFLLAVQPAPMTTATILPLNLSSQVANVSSPWACLASFDFWVPASTLQHTAAATSNANTWCHQSSFASMKWPECATTIATYLLHISLTDSHHALAYNYCCCCCLCLLQWPVVTAARWHVQIMMVTVQVRPAWQQLPGNTGTAPKRQGSCSAVAVLHSSAQPN
jgi:hypothetical protein